MSQGKFEIVDIDGLVPGSINTAVRPSSRQTALATLTYAGWLAIVVYAVETSLSTGWEPSAAIYASSLVGFMMIPNVIAFGVAAAIMKGSWRTLTLPELLAANLITSVATVLVFFAIILAFGTLGLKSETSARGAMTIAATVPGAIAAQLLRLSREGVSDESK